MNILIADDHAGVRHGLREILEDAISDAHCYEACDGNEVLELLANAEFDFMLLDLNMPGPGGMDVLRSVKRDYPELPVVMVSVQPEEQYAKRCLEAGAAAYIRKDRAPEELAQTAKAILSSLRANCLDSAL